MKTIIKLIALILLILASLIIPHRGFTMSEEEELKVKEPMDMAYYEMVDILNEAFIEVFDVNDIVNTEAGPEIMIFDFMDNLIFEGEQNNETVNSVLRCSDFLTEVSGTRMYKMNVERPIYKECKELLNLK